MKNLLATPRLSVLACACLFVCAASAQSTATPELKEIIITASRMEQVLQSAPVGASVLLGEDIRASGVIDANEAVRKLAGVASRSDFNGGRELSLDLRGFGDSSGSNMVVLIDGVRISENELVSARLSAISPDLIDRIEITRGGSSVVWGEGASAGVINVVTKVGKAKGISGSAQLGLQSYGGRDTRLALNVAGEGATFFAQGRSYTTKGVRQNSAHNNDAFNAGVQLGDDKGFKLRFAVFSENLNSRWPGAIALTDYVKNPKLSDNLKDNGTSEETRATIAAQYRLGDWTWSLDLASRERESKAFNDYGVFGDQDAISRSNSTQVSPRVSYSSSWGGTAVSALLGYDQSQWAYTRQANFSGFLGADEVAGQRNKATYAKADVLFPSQTRVVFGLRSERLKQDYQELVGLTSTDTQTRLNAWELGLNQSLSPQWDIYVRAAKSYRIANVDENRFLTTALKQQNAKDLELGLRFNSKASSAALRVFRQRTRNEIAYDNTLFSNVNLDPVRRTGLELEGRAVLARDWTLSGAVQTIKAVLVDGVNQGKTPPHIAKLNASARISYAVAPAHHVEAAMQYRSAAVLGNDTPNLCTQRTPARTTLDAMYRYRQTEGQGWSFSAGVDNLTNAKGYSWAFTNSSCDPINVYPEIGRIFKLSARYQF